MLSYLWQKWLVTTQVGIFARGIFYFPPAWTCAFVFTLHGRWHCKGPTPAAPFHKRGSCSTYVCVLMCRRVTAVWWLSLSWKNNSWLSALILLNSQMGWRIWFTESANTPRMPSETWCFNVITFFTFASAAMCRGGLGGAKTASLGGPTSIVLVLYWKALWILLVGCDPLSKYDKWFMHLRICWQSTMGFFVMRLHLSGMNNLTVQCCVFFCPCKINLQVILNISQEKLCGEKLLIESLNKYHHTLSCVVVDLLFVILKKKSAFFWLRRVWGGEFFDCFSLKETVRYSKII